LYKKSGKTKAHRIKTNDYTKEEIAKIHREVIRSNGELLFSTGIVLAEGITEEQALPVFFEKYFGFDPNYYGMAFLGIRGQNYKTYLKLVRDFQIPWFIFGDGETSAISTIKNALKVAFENDDIPDNVIIIDNGDDYENHLIRNSYGDYIIDAINSYELQLLQDAEPEIAARDTKTYFEKFIDRKNHSVEKSQKTGRQCFSRQPCPRRYVALHQTYSPTLCR
jgi:putative ATP-dependent endonuclease of OLD family